MYTRARALGRAYQMASEFTSIILLASHTRPRRARHAHKIALITFIFVYILPLSLSHYAGAYAASASVADKLTSPAT